MNKTISTAIKYQKEAYNRYIKVLFQIVEEKIILWDGTVPQKRDSKETDIRNYFRYNMPMKREYLEYLNKNQEFYQDMVEVFGYTDQIKGILNKTYISAGY